MAAYGALVSLMHLIEQLQHHPRPPISLDKEQAQSLIEKVAFMQDFLEVYNLRSDNQEVRRLESRIATAAYAAEDIIESHIVDEIHARSTSTHDRESISSVDFYQGLHLVSEEMNFIKKEVIEIKDKMGTQDQVQRVITTPAVSNKSSSTEHNTMMGFDHMLHELLDKLTGQSSDRQIIPISGMSGIGKSTLARNLYTSPLIKHHFYVRPWGTITQEYDIREILLDVLLCQKDQGNKKTLSGKREQDLGLQLHQSLSGRRYLIILDDMWDVEVWDRVKKFFPDNKNGSRIVITTRLAKLALDLGGTLGLEMNFLDGYNSWNLLCKTVFGGQDCPPELEQIGNRIAKNCKGLPLSIVVIGGLLAKSKPTKEYWEHIAKNLNSVVNLDDNKRCLKILYTSYNQLPIHLKPCFLYMGAFPEDSQIRVSQLIKLWVAEGFLKPVSGESLEESAKKYLMDLVDRNLILVNIDKLSGKLISCNIHDLLRDLCLREAERESFLYVTSQHSPSLTPHGISTHRCVAIHESTSKEDCPKVLQALQSTSLARSLIFHFGGDLPSLGFRLLRVFKPIVTRKRLSTIADIFQLVNSRYLDVTTYLRPHSSFSSLYHFWNLQTIIVKNVTTSAPSEFWLIPLLRHVHFAGLYLPDPLSGQMDKRDDIVQENLQTLWRIENFKCSEGVVKRIPNVKKLQISYDNSSSEFEVASHYCLNNLDRLHKLESLACFFFYGPPIRNDLLQNLSFPDSLKKLTLHYSRLHWEDMSTKIGTLPHLQVLKLDYKSFEGPKWETVEGQFLSLKYLLIDWCHGLVYWITESTHFPRLEHLVLKRLNKLKEIPCDVGDIPTLKSIQLENCLDSLVVSAKRIVEEQKDFGTKTSNLLSSGKDESKKRRIAGILSYITHLIKFKDRHSMDGVSSAERHKLPSILSQKFSSMFGSTNEKIIPDEKQKLLISYVLVLSLFADDFLSDPSDIAKDLRMNPIMLRPH